MDIYIDYNIVQWIFVAVFGFVGFFRGWFKELFTTFLLVLMALPLFNEDLANYIIGLANRIIEIIRRFFSIVMNSETSDVQAFSVDNSYTLFITVLAILVLLSYMSDRIGFGPRGVTAFSAVLGALLGSLNGFLILSLIKDYLLGNFFREQAVQAFATPSDISMSVENVPTTSFFSSFSYLLPIFVVGVLFFIIFGRLFRVQPPISRR